jgi:ankyrin repeat protein
LFTKEVPIMSSAKSLSLAQLRIQAKELLQAVRSADPASLQRVLPYFESATNLRLANTQLVIARENGFPSWAVLKRSLDDTRAIGGNPTAQFFKAIEALDVDAVRGALGEMPELGASWRQTPRSYWESALHVAAQKGSIEIAQLLIDAGAEIYGIRQGGYPPVDNANDHHQSEMVEFLLRISAERDEGAPPTYGVGIDLVLAARIGWLDRVRAHVDRDPFAVYRRGCIGESVLHWPAHNGHAEILRYLLEKGAVVEADEIGLYGGKPLHWASEHAPESVKILLAAGANPNSRNQFANDFEGYTPLHMCARQSEQCFECAELLLAAGADPTLKDKQGQFAADVARRNGRTEMEKFLNSRTG